jgi:hypothetical protein
LALYAAARTIPLDLFALWAIYKRKRSKFPSGLISGMGLAIWLWLMQKWRNAAFADFGRLQRSGALSS